MLKQKSRYISAPAFVFVLVGRSGSMGPSFVRRPLDTSMRYFFSKSEFEFLGVEIYVKAKKQLHFCNGFCVCTGWEIGFDVTELRPPTP
jgi:hypothetical protein